MGRCPALYRNHPVEDRNRLTAFQAPEFLLQAAPVIPDIPHLSKAIFDLKCSPLKFTKRVDYKNLQQLQLGSSRLNSRNG